MLSPTISVALCTYNGARYISQQLQSILDQTLLPTELVICDDASTDQTLAIIESFARTAPFDLKLHVQPQNIGWRANREDCYRRCTGTLIAPCDQDDLWKPEKLKLLAHALNQSPDCDLVFSDSEVVDENLNPLGYRSWETHSLNPHRQQLILTGSSLLALLPNTPVADASLMFQSRILSTVLPLPQNWEPDAWLVLIAASLNGCTLVPQPLQLHRQHTTNLMGERRRTPWARYQSMRSSVSNGLFAKQEAMFSVLQDRLTSIGKTSNDPAVKLVHERSNFAFTRRQMREKPWLKPFLIPRELLRGSYRRMGTGLRTLVLDLIT